MQLPESKSYTGYWPRSGFVNRTAAAPGVWPFDEPWNHRMMRKPEFRPPVDNSHPLKSQSFTSSGIMVGMADGSVRMVSAQISDERRCAAVSANGGEIVDLDP